MGLKSIASCVVVNVNIVVLFLRVSLVLETDVSDIDCQFI